MWEKSRFKNFTEAVSSNNASGPNTNDVAPQPTIPTWANATENTLGTFLQGSGVTENYAIQNGSLGTGNLQPIQFQLSSPCGVSQEYVDFQNIVFSNVSSLSGAGAFVNQWMLFDWEGCFDSVPPTSANIRPFNQWDNPIYFKAVSVVNFYNFTTFIVGGFYYNGQFFDYLSDLVDLYQSETGATADVWSTAKITPIFKNDGSEIQTLQELENYINPSSSPSLLETIASEDTMPDLAQLTTAFQTELQEKGSALTTSNETVTNLLGDYFDAVDFATETLNVKSADLNTALALCNSGSSGACSDVGQLTTTVNTLRSDLEALESEDAIKTAIEGALDDIANTGTTGATNLGDAAGDIGAIEQQLSERQSSIDSLNAEITSKETQISSLESSLASSEGNVSDLTAELSSQYTNLNSQITAKANEISGLESDLFDATETIADNDEEIAEKASLINSLNNQLNSANSDYTSLEIQKAQVDADIVSLTSTNTGLTNEIGELGLEIASLSGEKSALQADIVILQSEATDNTQVIAQKVAQIDGLNVQLITITTERNNLQAGLDYQSGLATERLAEIGSLNVEINSINQQKTSLEIQNTSLGIDVNNLTTQVAQKESQIATLESQGVIDTSTITQLEGERNGLLSDLAQVNTEKQQLNSNISDLNDDVLELQGEKVQLQLDIADEENVSAGLQTQLTAKISEVQGLEANLLTEQQEKTNLENQISDAEADFATLEAFLESETESTNALGSQIQTEINALQGALSQFGYTPPTQENFSGFSGMNFVDLVKEAGQMRKQYLNFRGKVVQNDMNKSMVMNNKLNFSKPKSRVKFRADGGESFEKKYGTLGKIGLIGGLLYLITKK